MHREGSGNYSDLFAEGQFARESILVEFTSEQAEELKFAGCLTQNSEVYFLYTADIGFS